MGAPMMFDPRTSPTAQAALNVLRRALHGDLHVASSLRKDRLRRLLALLREHSTEFEAAISADCDHRSAHETSAPKPWSSKPASSAHCIHLMLDATKTRCHAIAIPVRLEPLDPAAAGRCIISPRNMEFDDND
jgi:hypothetical protein